MASGYQRDRDAAFEAHLTTTIVGIAARHSLVVDAEVAGEPTP
jgi:hypothetical protein